MIYTRIHLLVGGFPLCMFSRKPPAEWPAGHGWVSDDQIEHVTCPDCKDTGHVAPTPAPEPTGQTLPPT